MENELPISVLVALLKKNIKVILISVISCVLISILASQYLMKPVYEANTQVLVNQTQDQGPSLNISDVQSNIQLVNTYRVIIKSPRILEAVQKANPAYNIEQLNKAIDVNSESDSQVINIAVRDKNLKDAVKVANDTAEIFEAEIGNIMKIENVSILSKAEERFSRKPVFPILPLNVAVAGILGLLLAFAIIFFRTVLNKTVTSESELEEITKVLSLGSVRSISKKELERVKVKEDDQEDENV